MNYLHYGSAAMKTLLYSKQKLNFVPLQLAKICNANCRSKSYMDLNKSRFLVPIQSRQKCNKQCSSDTVLKQHIRKFSTVESDNAKEHGCVEYEDFSTDEFDNHIEKIMPLTRAQQKIILRKKPNPPKHSKILRVAIIGAPNAGKSTLANGLVGSRYSTVSSKVHTTRKKSVGVLTEGQTQIVFLDTPGMINSKKRRFHKLEKSLLTDPHSSLYQADMIIVLVDVSELWHRSELNLEIRKALELHRDKHIILVQNKTDLYSRKDELLHTTRKLTAGTIAGKSDWYFKKTKKRNVNLDQLFDKVYQDTVSKENHSKPNVDTQASNSEDNAVWVENLSNFKKNIFSTSLPDFQTSEENGKNLEKNMDTEGLENSKMLDERQLSGKVKEDMLKTVSMDNKVQKENFSSFNEKLHHSKSVLNYEKDSSFNDSNLGHSICGSDSDEYEVFAVSEDSRDVFAEKKSSDIRKDFRKFYNNEEKVGKNEENISVDNAKNDLNVGLNDDVTVSVYKGSTFKKDHMGVVCEENTENKPQIGTPNLNDNLEWENYYNKVLKDIQFEVEGKAGFDGFQRVFYISALNQTGVCDIKDYLLEKAKPGAWMYNESVLTDIDPMEIAKMCVKEKVLDNFPSKDSYIAIINTTLWLVDDAGVLRTSFDINFPRPIYVRAEVIKKIATEAKQELMNTFKQEMTVRIVLKTKKKKDKR